MVTRLSESPDTIGAPRTNWWKRLSICVLAVLSFGILFSTLFVIRYGSLRQHYAARRLKELRCDLTIDERRPPQRRFSEMLFGNDQWNWTYLIRINSRSLSNGDAALLTCFPRLSIVVVNSCPSANDVLTECVRLSRLKEVYLYDCHEINGAAVQILAECSGLETLVIEHSQRPLDLSPLSNARKLECLILFGMTFGDETAAEISSCTELRLLKMIGTRLTDEGLNALGELPNLETLVIRDADIKGAALSHFAHTMCLRDLDLSGSRVSEVGLNAIRQIESLRSLALDASQVNDTQLAELREALPGL